MWIKAGVGSRYDDRAACGVVAEQGALGALQDLNARDVQQLEVARDRIGVVKAVDVDADVRAAARGRDIGADSADRGLEEARLVIEPKRWGELLDVAQSLDIGGNQFLDA
jgi:hypothetical protein